MVTIERNIVFVQVCTRITGELIATKANVEISDGSFKTKSVIYVTICIIE